MSNWAAHWAIEAGKSEVWSVEYADGIYSSKMEFKKIKKNNSVIIIICCVLLRFLYVLWLIPSCGVTYCTTRKDWRWIDDFNII